MSITPPRPRNARLGRAAAEMIRTTLYAACKHSASIYVNISEYHIAGFREWQVSFNFCQENKKVNPKKRQFYSFLGF